MSRRLLLISSSRTWGTGYLEHCFEAIAAHLQERKTLLFIPFALQDHEGYAGRVREALAPMGVQVESVHTAPSPFEAIDRAESIFTGGGNTFRLLRTLQQRGLIDSLRQRILEGVPYIGSSAGTNIVCPTIRTTNDMPIVQPATLDALNLVRIQINPHFVDADPDNHHQGETREHRINEFHEENLAPVVGLREGSWLLIDGGSATLQGDRGAMLFRRQIPPLALDPGTRLDALVEV